MRDAAAVDRQPQADLWPAAQPYDVIFYRAPGTKAVVNILSQHVYDPAIAREREKFTHCALVASELTAVEAYPRAVPGRFTAMLHPGGVRFVPVADMCCDSPARYRGFAVLRPPPTGATSETLGAEAIAAAWALLRHRYGLRGFLGLRHRRLPGEPVAEPGTQWLSCADIVLEILSASGRFGLDPRAAVGPCTLFAELKSLGWREVTADYAPDRFHAKRRRYEATRTGLGWAGLDVFAVRMAFIAGTLTEAVRSQQYRLEALANAQFAHAGPDGRIEDAISLLEDMRARLGDELAASAETLMADLVSRRGLLK